MYHGFERMSIRKHHLVVNKKGFASLYALLILQIVLAFVLLLLRSSTTFFVAKTMQNDLHQAQIYAIYHAKVHIQNSTIDNEEDMEENIDAEVELLSYRGQSIELIYQDAQVLITIAHLQFQLDYDLQTKNILNLVYL